MSSVVCFSILDDRVGNQATESILASNIVCTTVIPTSESVIEGARRVRLRMLYWLLTSS